MRDLEHDYKAVLLANHEGPCLSLYQPTHRTFPDRKQDPIRFGNLLKELEKSLKRQHGDREAKELLEPFRALEEDEPFWNHTLEGIAVFATPDSFRVYNLQRSVPERAIVADSFHTKPLLRIIQSADRYHVLGLNRHDAAIYQGNRFALDAVAPNPGFPDTIEKAAGEDVQDPERSNRAHGREGRGMLARHGVDVRQDIKDADTREFFRAVDEAVMQDYSRPTGMPLILAALPEHHHMFREISDNPALVSTAIDVDPASVTAQDLCERAWHIMQPVYLERLEKLVEQYGASSSAGHGSADLTEIGKAAAAGRIATLMIDADRVVPGQFDPETGHVSFARLEDPDVDDLLDDLGEHTLRMGGDVISVPPERMPSDTGIAAIYRF